MEILNKEKERIIEKADNYNKYKGAFDKNFVFLIIFIAILFFLFKIEKTNLIVNIILSIFIILFIFLLIKNLIFVRKYELNLKEYTVFKIEKLKELLDKAETINKNWDEIKSDLSDLMSRYDLELSSEEGFDKIDEINKFIEKVYETLNYYITKDNFKKESTQIYLFLNTLENKIWSEDFKLRDLAFKEKKKKISFFQIKKILENKWSIIIIMLILGFLFSWGIFKFRLDNLPGLVGLWIALEVGIIAMLRFYRFLGSKLKVKS